MATKTLIIFSVFATIYCGCLANSTLEMQEVISEPDILIMNPGSRFLVEVEDIARKGCDDDMENIECFKQIGPEELVAEARGTCCYRRRVCRWYSKRRICRYIRRCNNCPRRNPVNCIWSNWRSYSSCSKTCGGGIQSRSRYKTRRDANGGSCYGSRTMTRACNTQNCPINCEWSNWQTYSSCSKTCGGGTQSRSRSKVINEANGGICPGSASMTRDCNAQICPGSLIMVATGQYPYTNKSQVINVSSSSTACANLPSYPFSMYGGAGGVVNGSPIICGGYRNRGSPRRTESCYRFDRNSTSWKFHSNMTSIRYYHAATVVKDVLFISGGLYSSNLATTEYIYSNGTVQSGPNLPLGRHGHCTVTLHDGKVMIIGADYHSSLRKNVLTFDAADNSFTTGPSLSYDRRHAACTLFHSDLHNGRPVVLSVGGVSQATAELYDYTISNQWQTIESLPTSDTSNFVGARALPSTTGNGAYFQMREYLYELTCSSNSCTWSLTPQKLSRSVYRAVMMYLPDNHMCTN